MMHARTNDLATLAPAWAAMQASAPVKLQSVTSESHYRGMVRFMNRLLDEIGDDEGHPLLGLLDIVTAFVEEYEEWKAPLPAAFI